MTKRRKPSRSRARKTARLAIVWTVRAVTDLEEIGDYIAHDDPAAAARWVNSLMQCAEQAAIAPLAGRRVPELGRDDVRELFRSSYRIVYRVAETRIEILTVFEGHRQFPDDVPIEPIR